jgi:hypothetical protein
MCFVRKSVRKFLVDVFKFLVIVIAMALLYTVLELMSLVLISILYPVEGNWLATTVTFFVVYVFSILVVCFMVGLLYPVNFWVVHAAALFYVIYCFVGEIYVLIRAQIYLSTNYERSLGYTLFGYKILKYAIIILLIYYLSRPLNRWGSALRSRCGLTCEV